MVIFYVAVDQYPCINMQLWDENLFASYFCYQGVQRFDPQRNQTQWTACGRAFGFGGHLGG